MVKLAAPRALIVRINLTLFAFLLIAYITRMHEGTLLNNKLVSLVQCSLHDCHSKFEDGNVKKKEISTKRLTEENSLEPFSQFLHGGTRLALVNMGMAEAVVLGLEASKTTVVHFNHVPSSLKWSDLYPGWIDEAKEYTNGTLACPEIPMPDFSRYDEVDVVIAKVPCRRPERGRKPDVFRLQVHLVAAELAVRTGRKDGKGAVRLAFYSECWPMIEVFRCDDLVGREGKWWMYEVEAERLEEKVALPVGSCRLAMPLWPEGTATEVNRSSHDDPPTANTVHHRREAYATVLHSSSSYVCGAIALARSILKAGTTRDLLLLHDSSIPLPALRALSAAGWALRPVTRIRNPHARRGSYNEHNYTKLRLWQLAGYTKILFVDADVLVLRSLDPLFRLPALSAAANHAHIFNSGVMLLEPSACTFAALMRRRRAVVPYNGGDHGFLNEAFEWWHRMPRRVNFLTHLSSGGAGDVGRMNFLFGSDPPKVYGIHYLGAKPWTCYRDYDCNWNKKGSGVYANDVAHWRWWRAYDEMDEGLRGFCGLSEERRGRLERERREAEELGFEDGHWRMEILDPRRNSIGG